jgi:ADP-ribose pyrophosphatase
MSDDAHLIEKGVGSELLVKGNFLEVRRDTVELPTGKTATREYVVHPGAVAIVALLDDGRIVLERQFRYPVGHVVTEIPAGKLEVGEDPLRCAQRELLEETGYSAREWASAGLIHNAAAYSTEIIHLFFARGLTSGAQQLDDGEFIETCLLDERHLDAMVSRGELTDVKTLIGLQWLQRWRAGAWPLHFRSA